MQFPLSWIPAPVSVSRVQQMDSEHGLCYIGRTVWCGVIVGCHTFRRALLNCSVMGAVVVAGPWLSTREREGLAGVACEALSLFAVNPASHRSLQAERPPNAHLYSHQHAHTHPLRCSPCSVTCSPLTTK